MLIVGECKKQEKKIIENMMWFICKNMMVFFVKNEMMIYLQFTFWRDEVILTRRVEFFLCGSFSDDGWFTFVKEKRVKMLQFTQFILQKMFAVHESSTV